MQKTIYRLRILYASIIAATGASFVSAGNIYVEATGVAVNQQTTVQNVPGLAVAPIPPFYQEPRLRNYGGDGWASKIQLVIDDTTGAVSDYRLTLTDPLGQNFGSGGPQFEIRSAGRAYSFADGFDGSNCQVAPAFIPELLVNSSAFPGAPALVGRGDIPANGDGNTLDGSGNGILVYHCAATVNVPSFAKLYAPNHLCGTPSPTSFVPGENGCAAEWSGSVSSVEPAISPVTYLPANHINSQDPGGLSWDVSGFLPNPEVFITTDTKQNFVSRRVHEFQGGKNGGSFLIRHTGTLNEATFSVTSIDYFHDVSTRFPVPGLPIGPWMSHAQSFTHFEFSANIVQSNPAQGNKNVPAMGAFGLIVLFGGLFAIGSRLRRRA